MLREMRGEAFFKLVCILNIRYAAALQPADCKGTVNY